MSKGLKIALLVPNLGSLTESVDFAYQWSCIGKGLCVPACLH